MALPFRLSAFQNDIYTYCTIYVKYMIFNFTGKIPQGFPSQRYTLSLNEYIQIAWGWLYHSNMGWKVKGTINRDTVNTEFAIELHNVHWSHFGSHEKTSDLLDVLIVTCEYLTIPWVPLKMIKKGALNSFPRKSVFAGFSFQPLQFF